VLVVLDTVRADHLSAYGYPRPTTPHLQGFAAGAVRYENAKSSSPWTLPSHASLFTGRPPSEHGAHLRPDGTAEPLDAHLPTLAEELAAAGYRTGAIVANTGFLAERWGLARGFDDYEVAGVRAAGVTERALRWLDAHDDGPVFLFLNYMDAHRPFHTEIARPEVVGGAADPTMDPLDRLKAVVLPSEQDAPPDLVRAVVDQYDTALANLDAGLAPLLQRLRDERAHTVAVITSDHGEFLGEHRWGEHPRDVHQPGVAVPLVVAAPGRPPGTSDAVMLSHDVPRLILDASGLDATRFPAQPPVAELFADHAPYLARPELRARMARVRRAVFEGSYALIVTEPGGVELFDLARDPSEATDLAHLEPGVVARLRERLPPVRPLRAQAPPPLTPDERAQLEALGYLE